MKERRVERFYHIGTTAWVCPLAHFRVVVDLHLGTDRGELTVEQNGLLDVIARGFPRIARRPLAFRPLYAPSKFRSCVVDAVRMRTAATWFALLVISAAAFEFPSFSSTPAPAKAPSAEQQAPWVLSVASTEQPAKPAWSSAHHLALAAAIIALVGAAAAFAAPHGRKQTAEQQALARAQAQRDAEVEEMCALANAREQRLRGVAPAAATAAAPAAAAAAAAAEAEPETVCWGCGARDERGDFKACSKCVAIMHRPSKFCSEACLRSARQHVQRAARAVRQLGFWASSGRSVARGLERVSAYVTLQHPCVSPSRPYIPPCSSSL